MNDYRKDIINSTSAAARARKGTSTPPRGRAPRARRCPGVALAAALGCGAPYCILCSSYSHYKHQRMLLQILVEFMDNCSTARNAMHQ